LQVPPAEGAVVEEWQEHGWVHKIVVAGEQQKEYAVDVKTPLPIVMYPLDKHRELLREFKDEQGFTHKVRMAPSRELTLSLRCSSFTAREKAKTARLISR
jgi:hypothetical protein